MIVKIVADFEGLKKGERHELHPTQAEALISGGFAIKQTERTIDKRAEHALLAAKQRDSHH